MQLLKHLNICDTLFDTSEVTSWVTFSFFFVFDLRYPSSTESERGRRLRTALSLAESIDEDRLAEQRKRRKERRKEMEKERRKAIRAARQRQKEAKKKSVSFNVRTTILVIILILIIILILESFSWRRNIAKNRRLQKSKILWSFQKI